MTQDGYLGRRAVDPRVALALEGFNPDTGPVNRRGGPARCPSPRLLRV